MQKPLWFVLQALGSRQLSSICIHSFFPSLFFALEEAGEGPAAAAGAPANWCWGAMSLAAPFWWAAIAVPMLLHGCSAFHEHCPGLGRTERPPSVRHNCLPDGCLPLHVLPVLTGRGHCVSPLLWLRCLLGKVTLGKCPIEVAPSSQPWVSKGGGKRLKHRADTVPRCPQPHCAGSVTQGTRWRSRGRCQAWERCQTLLRNERGGDGKRQLEPAPGPMPPACCRQDHADAAGAMVVLLVPPVPCWGSAADPGALSAGRVCGMLQAVVPNVIFSRRAQHLCLCCILVVCAPVPALSPGAVTAVPALLQRAPARWHCSCCEGGLGPEQPLGSAAVVAVAGRSCHTPWHVLCWHCQRPGPSHHGHGALLPLCSSP